MNENIEGVTESCLAGVAAGRPPPKVRDKADKVSAPPRPGEPSSSITHGESFSPRGLLHHVTIFSIFKLGHHGNKSIIFCQDLRNLDNLFKAHTPLRPDSLKWVCGGKFYKISGQKV